MKAAQLFFDRVAPTTVTRCPRRIMSVVVELEPLKVKPKSATTTVGTKLKAWHLVASHYDGCSGWLRESYDGDSALSFWSLMVNLCQDTGTTWIVAPSVSEVLASTGGYEELTAGRLWIPGWTDPDSKERYRKGCTKGQRDGWLTLNGPTEIIIGRYLSSEVRWIAASNYGVTDWPKFMKQRAGKLELSQLSLSGPERFRGCGGSVARAIDRWLTGMIDSWRSGECGMFGETASKLAFNFYKRQYATKAVVKHQNVDVHRMERAGLFGGRAEVYRYGEQRGEFFMLDYRSMHPSILLSERAPVGLETYVPKPTIAGIADALRTHEAIATVTIDTAEPRYPFKLRLGAVAKTEWTPAGNKVKPTNPMTRTIYPVGHFTTTLCGPELRRAMSTGIVQTIHEAAIYRTSAEFQPMMRQCLDSRREAEQRGDDDTAGFWKLIANSFAGRWAQRSGGWRTDKRICNAEAWATWVGTHPDTGEPCRCRNIGFLPQLWEPMSDKPKGCPIIFAWLTACGRDRLYKLVSLAGWGEVIQADTDGLWLTKRGLQRCEAASGIIGDEPGQLRIQRTAKICEFFTPRHNIIDGQYTMSGFSDGFRVKDDGTVVDFQRSSYYPADSADGPSCTVINERNSDISTLADFHRARMAKGKTAPWILRRGDSSLIHPKTLLPFTKPADLFTLDLPEPLAE